MEEIVPGDKPEVVRKISFIEVRREEGFEPRYIVSYEGDDGVESMTFPELVAKFYLVTPQTLWYDADAITEYRKSNIHPLTREVAVYIQNDFEKLRDVVWFVLDRAKKTSQEEINFRKQHICDVVEISQRLLRRCIRKIELLPNDDQKKIEYIRDNGLEWSVTMVAYLHDMYKLRSNSMDHGGLAASYFVQNICRYRSDFVTEIENAIRYHSYPELGLQSILYKIIVDADNLSKYSLGYMEHKQSLEKKKRPLPKVIKKVRKVLDLHKGFTPWYGMLREEFLADLIQGLAEREVVKGNEPQ